MAHLCGEFLHIKGPPRKKKEKKKKETKRFLR
jgi:hypothetical protein